MPETYRRMRMAFGPGGRDITKLAWESDRVGIWYGGWNVEDFEEALLRTGLNEQRKCLSQSPAQSKLFELSSQNFQTCLRFNSIHNSDWVYVYFESALHFARISGPMQSSDSSEFNLPNPDYPGGPLELFKYRPITDKKSFLLGKLPTSFLILRSAGRNNVYEHNGSYWHFVNMLAECCDEAEVCERFRNLSPAQWLAWASDKTWEAVCEAYLILEADFVPVGLKVGGTLTELDIVGCSKKGATILAQCKKHPTQVTIEKTFVSLCSAFPEPEEIYYFAYGGVTSDVADVRVIDKINICNWLDKTSNGRLYSKMLGLA